MKNEKGSAEAKRKSEIGKAETSDREMQNEEGRMEKADHQGVQSPKSKVQGGERGSRQVQEWWASLTPGERKLICSVMGLLRGAKRSQFRDVANAAAKWERGIGCFIKVRLLAEGHQRGTWKKRKSKSGSYFMPVSLA